MHYYVYILVEVTSASLRVIRNRLEKYGLIHKAMHKWLGLLYLLAPNVGDWFVSVSILTNVYWSTIASPISIRPLKPLRCPILIHNSYLSILLHWYSSKVHIWIYMKYLNNKSTFKKKNIHSLHLYCQQETCKKRQPCWLILHLTLAILSSVTHQFLCSFILLGWNVQPWDLRCLTLGLCGVFMFLKFVITLFRPVLLNGMKMSISFLYQQVKFKTLFLPIHCHTVLISISINCLYVYSFRP